MQFGLCLHVSAGVKEMEREWDWVSQSACQKKAEKYAGPVMSLAVKYSCN